MAEHAHAEAAPETTAAPTPVVSLRGASQVPKIAIKKLRDYDGSSPSEVKTALKEHFNSESKWVAKIVANNLDQGNGRARLANSDPYGMLCFDVRLP